MRTANEIRAARLREACCSACAEKTGPCKVSADQPPKGDGGIEVQAEAVVEETFVDRAARAIVEGVEEEAAPAPLSPTVSRALAGVRARVRNVSA